MKNILFRSLLASLIIMILFSGCSKKMRDGIKSVKNSLSELFELRKEIKAEIKDGDVGINIVNNSYLQISLVNSEFNDKTKIEREEKAKEIYEYLNNKVTESKQLENIQKISVFFVQSKKILVFSSNNVIDGYNFVLDFQEVTKE